MTWPSTQDIAGNNPLFDDGRAQDRFATRDRDLACVYCDRFYLFAETGKAAAWVKNIRCNPEVVVRIGAPRIDARARVLDREIDRELWDQVAAIADRKYGWGDGLPVEITPSLPRAAAPAGTV